MQNEKDTDLTDKSRTRSGQSTDFQQKRKAWINPGRALIPLLFIWGAQWIFSALIDVAIYWRDLDWLRQAALITAVIASLIQIWSLRKDWVALAADSAGGDAVSGGNGEARAAVRLGRGSDVAGSRSGGWGHPALLLLPGALLLAAIALLEAIGAVAPLFVPVLRAFILAVGFVQVGLLLGKPLVYLGLWLFALTVIMGVWYLGYSAVILEGMGGLSLLLSGYMLRVWGR